MALRNDHVVSNLKGGAANSTPLFNSEPRLATKKKPWQSSAEVRRGKLDCRLLTRHSRFLGFFFWCPETLFADFLPLHECDIFFASF